MALTFKARRLFNAVAIAVVSLIIFFWLLTERMQYFDYENSTCRFGDISAHVRMVGTFDFETPTVRGSPYYARIEIQALAKSRVDQIAIKSVILVPLNNSRNIRIPIGSSKDIEFEAGKEVFVSDPVFAPYEEFVMAITIEAQGRTIRLQCPIRRDYSEEIRVPIWDQLFSV